MATEHRDPPDPAVDSDQRFTTRGARASYSSASDYLLVAIMLLGLGLGFAVLIGLDAATDPVMREKLQHPPALRLIVLIGAPGGVGGWALRRFVRWRRARIDYARLTGTPYRTIFTRSSA